MFRELINNVPFSLLLLSFIILFMSITYLASLLPYNFFNKGDSQHRLLLVHSIMSILTGGFFVLLAFIIITTWNYMQEARTDTAKEASSLALILRHVKAFPPEPQNKIKKEAIDYLLSVRINEWEAMRHGRDDPKASTELEQLYTTIQNYEPTTPHETVFYSLINTNITDLIQARRERLEKMISLIPDTLSYSIGWGAIFIAFTLGFIKGKGSVFNIIPILLFSALLGFNIALALSFEYPFSGDINVTSSAFYNGILHAIPDPPSPKE